MKIAAQTLARSLVAVATLACCGCPGILPNETMDLGAPAQCAAAEDCGEGVTCIFPNGVDQPGICDVEEAQVTLGTPAPCNTDEDCPEGIGCVLPDGENLTGFCDIEETLVQ